MDVSFHTENRALINSVTSFITAWNDETPYFEVKTSGSTGVPKIIKIQKKHARASARMTGDYLQLKAGQRALLCLSPDTIAGKMMIVRSLEFDLHLHIVSPSSNPFKNVAFSVDFAAMVPLQLENAIRLSSHAFGSAQQIIVGGGPISPELEKQAALLPSQIYHSFGMTETISHFALRSISSKDTRFVALPGVEVSSVNGQLKVTARHLGVLELVTNDCITLQNERAFTWLGRTDFVINSGGVKIHPEEIEKLLSNLIHAPFFIIGIPNTSLGEKVILCIESDPYPIQKEMLLDILPKYHMPKSIYFFSSFQRTKSNKINRPSTIATGKFHEKSLL